MKGDDSSPRFAPGPLRRELAIVFVASVLATGGVTLLLRLVPSLGGWSWLVVAAVFLFLPTWVVRRFRREEPEDAGMRFGSPLRGLLVSLVLTLLTIAPFAAGYHVWSTTVWSKSFAPAVDNYRKWPAEVEGRPAGVDSEEEGLWIWSRGKALRVWWRSGAPVSLEIRGADEVVARGNGTRITEGSEGELSVAGSSGLRGVDLRSDGAVVVSAGETGGLDVAHLGASEVEEELPWEGEREWWWLLGLMLTQLVFVAFPEEYFYRGYVQETLRRVFGGSATGETGWVRALFLPEVLIGSVLFSLGHFLIDWNVARLAVFFPSLVFGAARVRTDGLTAPIVYHCMCNVMVEVVAVHYS